MGVSIYYIHIFLFVKSFYKKNPTKSEPLVGLVSQPLLVTIRLLHQADHVQRQGRTYQVEPSS